MIFCSVTGWANLQIRKPLTEQMAGSVEGHLETTLRVYKMIPKGTCVYLGICTATYMGIYTRGKRDK